MGETFGEVIDYWRIRRFVHGFQHDMNDAHDFVPHASVIAISQLAKLCEEQPIDFDATAERIIAQKLVVSPGMLHISMLEHYIPSEMVIAKVSTKFGGSLYVPHSGGDVGVVIEKSEKPFADGDKETPGRVYTFRMRGPGLLGDEINLFGNRECRIVAFPDTVPAHEIAVYFQEDFREMQDSTRHAIDKAGKDTNITHVHDNYYWSSIRQDLLPREAKLPPPIRRGGNISQLELLAKLPRVLSLYREKIEDERPPYLEPVEATGPYHAYAELEKSLGKAEDVGERAYQLANGMMYVYGTQCAFFDPWVECPFDKYFTLSTFLTKHKGNKNVFVSQMMLPTGCAYVDTSMFSAAPAIPERVMKLLYDKKLDVCSMEKFE
jgi:hypothetical protein